MWPHQEDDHEVSWKPKLSSSNQQKERGPHPDYEFNLQTSYKFIEKVQTYLKSGMRMEVTGNNTLPKSLLVISWRPPTHAPMGNWANPIFLHQDRFTFSKELERVFNDYMKNAEAFERKYLQQFKSLP